MCVCECWGGLRFPGQAAAPGRGEAWRLPRGRVAAEAPLSLRAPPWRGRRGPPHRHQQQHPRVLPRLPPRPLAAWGRTEAAPPCRRVTPSPLPSPLSPPQCPGPAPALCRGEARGRRARPAACPRPLPGRGGEEEEEKASEGQAEQLGEGLQEPSSLPPGGEEESESRGERLRMIT